MKSVWLRFAKIFFVAVSICGAYAAGFITVYSKTPLYWRLIHAKNRLIEPIQPGGESFLRSNARFVNASPFAAKAGDDYPRSAVSSAAALLADQGFENAGQSTREVALRMLYFTYNYCSTAHAGQTVDFDDLFTNCQTLCGGYAFVLRGLLESQDIRTRYTNLYNIPFQGSHTAIEFLDDNDHWAFLDPTFGVYFTGSGSDSPLSLQQIAALAGKAVHHQLNRDGLPAFSVPLTALTHKGTEKWIHKNMALESYWKFEQSSAGDHSFLPLVINLSAQVRTIGSLEFTRHGEAVERWLNDTNRLLNDSDPLNDTSFNTSNLNSPGQRVNILRIRDIRPHKPYELSMRFYNWGPPAKVEIDKTMRRVSSDLTKFRIGSGNSLVRLRFTSSTDRAEFALYSWSDDRVEVFGIELRDIDAEPEVSAAEKSHRPVTLQVQ